MQRKTLIASTGDKYYLMWVELIPQKRIFKHLYYNYTNKNNVQWLDIFKLASSCNSATVTLCSDEEA